MDDPQDLKAAKWDALCRLADTVAALRALPDDAPTDSLKAHLKRLEADYMKAREAHRDALSARS